MDTPSTKSWAFDRPLGSPFAHPSGLLGRLAGRVMLLTNDQHDVLDLLDVRPGHHVLEIGYGPGGFIRRLATTSAAEIHGVDPSPEMRDQATRSVRDEVAGGRITLGLGTAADTGLPAGTLDRVVTLNTVAIWPDLKAGLREIHRVTRPGGMALIGWHSRTAPRRIARGLALPEPKLDHLETSMSELFSEVRRVELRTLTTFAAVR